MKYAHPGPSDDLMGAFPFSNPSIVELISSFRSDEMTVQSHG